MQEQQIDLAGMKVFVAMPSHRDIDPRVVNCLLRTQAFMFENGLPGCLQVAPTEAPVHHARSAMVKFFLATDCTHLFFVDSDMTWTVDDFFRLCALGTRLMCVGAAGVTKDAKRRFCVAAWDEENETDEFRVGDYGCAKVPGLGLAFMVIARPIIEALATKADPIVFGRDGEVMPDLFHWRKRKNSKGIYYTVGEDIGFCEDIRALGHDIWLDPSITLGHIGPYVYSRPFAEAVHA